MNEMKETKLNALEKSYESGLVTQEEYEKQKKEIGGMPEEKIEGAEDAEKPKISGASPMEEVKEVKLKSDKMLIISVAIIILLFGGILGLKYFAQDKPTTIDDLHNLNFKGKLKPDQGYLYKGVFSFVKFDNLWYTQMVSPKGTRFYNIQFRYGPKEVESIKINGMLNSELFNNATDFYATFDPLGNNFSSMALAVSDFDEHMTKVFFKRPIAACIKNETTACIDRPIITCNNTDKLVFYVKESNNTIVTYDKNCIVIEGSGLNLVKGVDRVLYDFYEIIK